MTDSTLKSFPVDLFSRRLDRVRNAAKSPEAQRLNRSLSQLRQSAAVLIACNPATLRPVSEF